MNKAIFFDRDDTLIKDVPYNSDPDLVSLMPGAKNICFELKKRGYLLFIISNQSGVGRGKITEEQVSAVNQRVLDLIGESLFTAVYCCYDAPDDRINECRKPSPKMILQAASEYNIDLPKSFLIGDKTSDIRAAKRAGCKALYLNSRLDSDDFTSVESIADFVAADLHEALACIVS